MDWLLAITMICSSKVDADAARPDCEAHFRACVEELQDTPPVKSKGYDKDDVAAFLLANPKKRPALCR